MILMETFISWSKPADQLRPSVPGKPRRFRPFWRVSGPLRAVFALLFAVSCQVGGDTPRIPPLSGAIQVNEPDHAAWVSSLQRADLDAIQVTLYARQQAWDSAQLVTHDAPDAVVSEIRAAKRAGLRVTLVLRVALEQGSVENRHLWHGMIWPPLDEVEDWFANYGRFARSGAEIARAENVDLLAIGSELSSLTSTAVLEETPDLYAYFLDPTRTAEVRDRLVDCAADIPAEHLAPDLRFVDGGSYETLEAFLSAQEESDRAWTRHVTGASSAQAVDIEALNRRRTLYERHWRALIADVRAVYAGPLSYAANFDQVEDVGFWDALDAIGVNAYYPLSRWGQEGDALQGALAASWTAIAERLNSLASRHGGAGRVLPVVLFELGWTRKAGSTVRPFSYHRVEVLETAATSPDGSVPLTCVHWATQPENPYERVEALRALERVVAGGAFPTLRGFTLWKLSTSPAHRSIEPFAVILDDADDADRLYLSAAADLAARLRSAEATGR